MSQPIPAFQYKPGYEGQVMVRVSHWGGSSTKLIDIGPNERLCSRCRGEERVRARFGGPHEDVSERDYMNCDCKGGKVKA